MQIAREEYANALENIEKCISLYNNEGRDLYLDLLLKRGCLLVMLGRYDEALKSLNLALAEDPSAADVYLVKAQIYAERQNMEALTECLTAYMRLRPEDNSIRALLAQAQFTEGNYEAAARQYEELMQNDPNAEIEYLYGLNAVRNSDFAAAEAALSSAISKDDSFDGIYYYRGVCRMSLGNYAGAIEDMTISIDRNDMMHASYYTRGICLLMNNEYEKGLADIKYAAGLSDDQEVTKQALHFLAELEAAQSADEASADPALPAERIQPPVILPPAAQADNESSS
jgi:tetratricopeptide (TPR) repeat protein